MTDDDDTNEMRKRYRYRTLILRGKVRLTIDSARRLIGPDCAYHLYRTVGASEENEHLQDRDEGALRRERAAEVG